MQHLLQKAFKIFVFVLFQSFQDFAPAAGHFRQGTLREGEPCPTADIHVTGEEAEGKTNQ
jgi:hypothetical protein